MPVSPEVQLPERLRQVEREPGLKCIQLGVGNTGLKVSVVIGPVRRQPAIKPPDQRLDHVTSLVERQLSDAVPVITPSGISEVVDVISECGPSMRGGLLETQPYGTWRPASCIAASRSIWAKRRYTRARSR